MPTITITATTLRALFETAARNGEAPPPTPLVPAASGGFQLELLQSTLETIVQLRYHNESFDDALLRLVVTRNGLQS